MTRFVIASAVKTSVRTTEISKPVIIAEYCGMNVMVVAVL